MKDAPGSPPDPGPLLSPLDCTALRREQTLTVYLVQVSVRSAEPGRWARGGDAMHSMRATEGLPESNPSLLPLSSRCRCRAGQLSANQGQQREPRACGDGQAAPSRPGTSRCKPAPAAAPA